MFEILYLFSVKAKRQAECRRAVERCEKKTEKHNMSQIEYLKGLSAINTVVQTEKGSIDPIIARNGRLPANNSRKFQGDSVLI